MPSSTPNCCSTCPGCGSPLAWVVGREAPPDGDEVAHFLVPVARIWDDVLHACGHQRLYCSEVCVQTRLARHWYDGRLDHGYTRRDPSTAADYFRSVGLTGSFWGL